MDIIEKTYEELRASIKNIDGCLCDSFHRIWRLDRTDTEEKRRFMESREEYRSQLKELESEIIEDQVRLKYRRTDGLENLFDVVKRHIERVNKVRGDVFTISSFLDTFSSLTDEDFKVKNDDVIDSIKSTLMKVSVTINRK